MAGSSYTEVRYKCRCMKAEETITVPSRWPGEPLKTWFELVLQPSVYICHRTQHPDCRATECEYVKLPLQEAPGQQTFLGLGSAPFLN